MDVTRHPEYNVYDMLLHFVSHLISTNKIFTSDNAN